MSFSKIGEIIRTEKDAFTTPNITRVFDNSTVEIISEQFRKNLHDTEMILFYQYQDRLFFPIWFEFRSINNNLLFLIEEFEIDSFDLLQRILNSSLQKEEGRTTKIAAIIYHTRSEPAFCFDLSNFKIEESYRIDVFE